MLWSGIRKLAGRSQYGKTARPSASLLTLSDDVAGRRGAGERSNAA
ncbi:MAG: hypothetical protein JW976_13830 [Syntrophaceae bacterium]|nr:hypothetical protein [Syntrophaceae bacterium]